MVCNVQNNGHANNYSNNYQVGHNTCQSNSTQFNKQSVLENVGELLRNLSPEGVRNLAKLLGSNQPISGNHGTGNCGAQGKNPNMMEQANVKDLLTPEKKGGASIKEGRTEDAAALGRYMDANPDKFPPPHSGGKTGANTWEQELSGAEGDRYLSGNERKTVEGAISSFRKDGGQINAANSQNTQHSNNHGNSVQNGNNDDLVKRLLQMLNGGGSNNTSQANNCSGKSGTSNQSNPNLEQANINDLLKLEKKGGASIKEGRTEDAAALGRYMDANPDKFPPPHSGGKTGANTWEQELSGAEGDRYLSSNERKSVEQAMSSFRKDGGQIGTQPNTNGAHKHGPANHSYTTQQNHNTANTGSNQTSNIEKANVKNLFNLEKNGGVTIKEGRTEDAAALGRFMDANPNLFPAPDAGGKTGANTWEQELSGAEGDRFLDKSERKDVERAMNVFRQSGGQI